MAHKLTPWFSGRIKPVRPGVYQRKGLNGTTQWSKWDGRQWLINCVKKENAAKAKVSSFYQTGLPWRGIAK